MTEASRARRLGDVAANDQQWWLWGGPGKRAARAGAALCRHARPAGRVGTQLKNELWEAAFATLTSSADQ